MRRGVALAGACLLLAGCATSPPPMTPAPVPPATTRSAPAPTAAQPQRARVPDLRGLAPASAADLLAAAGMRLGQRRTSCDLIGSAIPDRPGPVGSILCQSIPADSLAPSGIAIDYVINGGDS
jgi:hypothetical protein